MLLSVADVEIPFSFEFYFSNIINPQLLRKRTVKIKTLSARSSFQKFMAAFFKYHAMEAISR